MDKDIENIKKMLKLVDNEEEEEEEKHNPKGNL